MIGLFVFYQLVSTDCGMRNERTEGTRHKAEGSKGKTLLSFTAYCFLPSAFCSSQSAI